MGSLSLLKKLKPVDARKSMAHRYTKSFQEKLQELMDEEERRGEVTHEDRVDTILQQKQEQVEQLGHLARFYALPQIFVDTNENYNEMKRQHDEFTELHGVSHLHARELAATAMSEHVQEQQQQLSRGGSNASLDRQASGTSLDPRKLSALVKKGPYMAKAKQSGEAPTPGGSRGHMESRKNTSLSAMFRHSTPSSTDNAVVRNTTISAMLRDSTPSSTDNAVVKPTKAPPRPMYVNVQTLTKGMVFGLSDLFFDNQPNMSLVSNGAECVSISKKLFMEHASHAFITRIREDIYPYPSEEDLQENLESQVVWDFHRRQVVTHVVQDIQWNRGDKHDSRLSLAPALGY